MLKITGRMHNSKMVGFSEGLVERGGEGGGIHIHKGSIPTKGLLGLTKGLDHDGSYGSDIKLFPERWRPATMQGADRGGGRS